jgi:hypothetical protein
MDWFYISNSQQCGPVSDLQLDELLRAGTLTHDTLAWRQGQPEWQPLRAVRPTASPALAPPPIQGPGIETCAECRQPFAKTDLVFLNHSWVCAKCKPVFLQRLMEGAAPAHGAGLVWRSNRQIVTRSETPMPDRCVCCNGPANGFRLKRKLYWHHPAWYILVVISILIYLIVALIVRKKAQLDIGLCEAHRRQRTLFLAISWGAAVIGIALIIAAVAGYGGMLAVLGIILLLGAAVCGAVKVAIVSAAKIDKEFVWVKGAGKPFLAQLPEWTGPP